MSKDFHSLQLANIKKKAGGTYCAYEEVKGKYYLKFRKNGETTLFELTGTPNDVTEQRYNELLVLVLNTTSDTKTSTIEIKI